MSRYKVEFEAETHANQESYAPEYLKLVYKHRGVHVAVIVPVEYATKLKPEPQIGELWRAHNNKIAFVSSGSGDGPVLIYDHGGWDPVSFAKERIYPPEE
jgi:hypothetical protein